MNKEEEKETPEGMDRPKLEEGDHYLSPEGYMVFTRQYHLKRGYCCENGCRHCPYGSGAEQTVPPEQ